jgi:hypothetical protein
MIDTTEQRLAELELLRGEQAQRLAALEARIEHPFIADGIKQRDHRDAVQKMVTDQAAERAAALPKPPWTPKDGAPPESISFSDLVRNEVWPYRIPPADKWRGDLTAAQTLARCEAGSNIISEAGKVLLAHWKWRWADYQAAVHRSAGRPVPPPLADEVEVSKLAAERARESFAGAGGVLIEVAHSFTLLDNWDSLSWNTQVQLGPDKTEAEKTVMREAEAPIVIPEAAPKQKRGVFR